MSERSRRGRGKQATPARRRGRAVYLLAGVAVLGLAGLAAVAAAIEHVGVAPRTLAPYVEKRSSGHNPTIVGAGLFASRTMMEMDRGPAPAQPAVLPAALGVQPRAAGGADAGGIQVATPDALRAALQRVQPGDVITLLPGTYRFFNKVLDADRPGREGAPITVRAARPGSVRIEFDLQEGFRVTAPWWRFENLDIRGVCATDTYCEHAFHVVGAARHFASVNNAIADFNAHFKINGAGDDFPDDGLIEANTLFNTHVRDTANPVTPIDLVAASRWTIRANVIKDFIKGAGDGISYGAFAKGGGQANLFEGNLVWCEHELAGRRGQRVGLSFGGGGTGYAYCRDRRCITEQQGGIMRGNLIASCSDVGVYLNSAADSRIEDNTLVDTTGIDVRFASSSARLDGNLVDGPIRSRDGGLLHLGDNETASVWPSYVGRHPVRALFADPRRGDFTWSGKAPQRQGGRPGRDLCTGKPVRAYGAFDDFAACRRAPAQS